MVQPQGAPIPPPEFGPPPYEPPQPGFVPPHMPTDSSGPYMPSGHYPSPSGHTATVLVPSGTATTVTVLQGEIFQGAPVQTVCPHCQQAITTKITYEIGLMSFLLGFLCCFVG
uniref:Cell death-inducing p53-target protein 1 n=1 Tax=Pavo cristatus TaxID=9049 RepID=A0A8C9LAP0_PAVCR